MTAAVLGYGTKLLMHDGSGLLTALASFIEIGEIREGPDEDDTVAEVDVTNHQSPGRRREYIAGLIEGGTIDITVNLINDASQDATTGIQSVFASGATRRFIIQEPGAANGINVDCVVTSRGKARPVDDAMTMSLSLRKTGDETVSAMPT